MKSFIIGLVSALLIASPVVFATDTEHTAKSAAHHSTTAKHSAKKKCACHCGCSKNKHKKTPETEAKPSQNNEPVA